MQHVVNIRLIWEGKSINFLNLKKPCMVEISNI